MIEFLLLVVGLAFLWKGADFLISGASSIAKRFGVPAIVVGMTVVAFGTSLPEMVVNVFSSINGNSAIGLGNIVGSNIANIALILGVVGMLSITKVEKGTLKFEIPFVILTSILLLVFSYTGLIISTIEGIFFLLLFVGFIVYNFKLSKANIEDNTDFSESVIKSVIFVLSGLVLLYFGGEFVVDNAILISKMFGVSDFIISTTIVAFGTSLPELVTCVVAIRKGEHGLAVGNIIGSNIFNILLVLGVSSMILPITISGVFFDLYFMLFVSIFLLVLIMLPKKNYLTKVNGVMLFLIYVYYILFSVFK